MRRAEMTIDINEIFYSLQGEGTYIGLPTIFVRVAYCPLRCSWCDEPEALEKGRPMSLDEILEEVSKYPCGRVCVTGGEPLAQKDAIPLLQRLLEKGYHVTLETGGSCSIEELPISEELCISLDIKCPSSGMHEKMEMVNIELLSPCDQLKFVIADRGDYEYAKGVISKHKPVCEIIMQPVGGTELKELAEWVLQDGLRVRVLPQLHRIIWGEEKSR